MARGRGKSVFEAESDEARLIAPKDRLKDWVKTACPGDLFLASDKRGEGDGVLRVRHSGAFLTLTMEQVWRRQPAPWPFGGDGIVSFRIVGTSITYFSG